MLHNNPHAFSLFRWLAPGGANARLSTFIFHRVLPEPDDLLPWEPDAARFERIMAFIARNFHVLPLADAAAKLTAGQLPPAAACITFDDGYRDNYTVAAPILRRHGLTATFFIATGFIDGGRMWNDTVIEAVRCAAPGELDWRELGLGLCSIDDAGSRVRAYGDALTRLKHLDPSDRAERTAEIARRAGLENRSDLMMSREQVVDLREQGMTIGGHTVTHPILRCLSPEQARAEIEGGRDELAAWLGEAPTVFAYPNGRPGHDYSDRDVALVRQAGFSAAVSTAAATAGALSDVLQLPRFTPWDRSMPRFAVRCATTLLRAAPMS
ncbi:MAG: polysaccharide deacetylase family protein [Rubrivivax sp.]|nr:polysaccharide deacetylase family protein [Rubrivivax sp.]